MQRLIDANEILKSEHQHYDYMSDEYYVIVRDIENAPTVDAVEVVLCKDCKKYETINCPFARDFVKWDGFKFCAWGERKVLM